MLLSWYLLFGLGITSPAGIPIAGECRDGGAKTELTIGKQLVEIPLSPGGPYNTSGGPIHGDPQIINVHLLPHTHNDVGWLKTVDQYATGANNSIQIANVGLILDSVVEELDADKNRKFIYVEMAFFIRWWRRQSKAKKRLVRKLVAEGRLEFINAGWVMNDEAATMYTDIIDQHTNGALQVITEFGLDASPRIGWQIDPFGHSSFQNKAFRGMAFDGWLVGRADAQDMAIRNVTGALEMVYRTDASNASTSSDAIFMGLMYMYSPPPGFGFDVLDGDPPLQDDTLLEDVNIADRLAAFREICIKQGDSYNPDDKGQGESKNIILTMGMDFNYQQAKSWYHNMDKLIHYSKLVAAEQQGGSNDAILNVFYSNPRIYIQSRHRQYKGGKDMPTKNSDEDFFPYGDGAVAVIDVQKRTVDAIDGGHAYWTGYFTSRPNFKGMVRGASRTYTAARQLVATAIHRPEMEQEDTIVKLIDAIGLAQHHDAITGTEKQHVDDDYSKRLHVGTEEVMATVVIPEVLSRFNLPPNGGGYCPLLNESICSWTTNLSEASVLIAVYNSLSHPSSSLITLPIGDQSDNGLSPEELRISEMPMMRRLKGEERKLTVQKAASKEAVKSWLVPNFKGSYSLQFIAEDVPPLGATIYRITTQPARTTQQQRERHPIEPWSISNERYELSYNEEMSKGNYMFKLKNTHDGIEVNLNISFGYYESSNGSGPLIYGRDGQASGAYIFRPSCPEDPKVRSIANCRPKPANFTPVLLSSDDREGENIMKFAITHPSVDQQPSDGLVGHLTLQVPPKQAVVSISWDVAIYINGGAGKEAVLLVDSDITNNDGDFMTDSNGRDWIHRKVNYRSGWQLDVTDPVAMNYYPINSGLRIADQEGSNSEAARMLTLIPDRAHGGASLLPGQMEIMVHRRCLYDDLRGVDEALDETNCHDRICLPKNVIGQTQLLLEPLLKKDGKEADSDEYREQAHLARLPLLPIFAHDDPKRPPKSDYWSSSQMSSSTLPREVQILTLQLLNKNNTPLEYYEQACAKSRCILLRLAHTYAPGEGSTSVVHLNLAAKGALLEGFTLGKAIEVTLNAGKDLKTAEKERLKWSTIGDDDGIDKVLKNEVNWCDVSLEPLQIRTFIVSLIL